MRRPGSKIRIKIHSNSMDLDAAFDALLADANQSDSEERKKRKKREKKKAKKREREGDVDKVEEAPKPVPGDTGKGKMIEILCNDRLGNKVRVKCPQEETVGNVKKVRWGLTSDY